MSVKITNAEELGRAIAEAYQSGDQAAQVTAWQGFCRALSDQVRQDAAAIGQQMDADAPRRGFLLTEDVPIDVQLHRPTLFGLRHGIVVLRHLCHSLPLTSDWTPAHSSS